jgi:hypothetical protein
MPRREEEQLQRDLNTTDLTVGLVTTTDAVTGDVRVQATVRNKGPNPASSVRLTLALSGTATWHPAPPTCRVLDAIHARCELAELEARHQRVVTLTARPAGDTPIVITATVENARGPDSHPADNRASVNSR